MRRHLNLYVIMLLSGISFITSCSGPPPPVIDCDSFIENLRQARGAIETTPLEPYKLSSIPISYAESYVNIHLQAFKEARRRDQRNIEPDYLEAETARLESIQAQADETEITVTEIHIDNARFPVREYSSEENAVSDAEYLTLIKELSLTIPLDNGEEYYFTLSTLASKLHAYQKGKIIVEYITGLLPNEDKDVLDLLESLLGPPFYVED
jgi:hypothetical protein